MCTNGPSTGSSLTWNVTSSNGGNVLLTGVSNTITVTGSSDFVGHLLVFWDTSKNAGLTGTMTPLDSASQSYTICSPAPSITHTGPNPLTSVSFTFTPSPTTSTSVVLSITSIESRSASASCSWRIDTVPFTVIVSTPTGTPVATSPQPSPAPVATQTPNLVPLSNYQHSLTIVPGILTV